MNRKPSYEFDKGDIICRIGFPRKFVVVGHGSGHYIEGDSWHSYHVRDLNGRILGGHSTIGAGYCEAMFVKVGMYVHGKGEGSDENGV